LGQYTIQGTIANNDVATPEGLHLVGTDGNDVLSGESEDDLLEGGAGNDYLKGHAGRDVLKGGANDDRLNGGADQDTLEGGAGNDRYWVDQINDQVIEAANEGTDTVYASISYTLSADVEHLHLQGTDSINATGNALNNGLNGNSGNNRLIGGAGNDLLNGRAGADTLEGGTGDDRYWVDHINDQVIEAANEGTDAVYASLDYTLLTNVERLILQGTGHLNGTGNTLNNLLNGNNGNNSLIGGAGNDTLTGRDGNDRLRGEQGSDHLTGGNGLDDFVFDAISQGIDTITDFNPADDTLKVLAAGFGGGLTIGTLTADQFVLGSAAGDANDRFIYHQDTRALYFDSDGIGGAAQVQLATLTNRPVLTHNDIQII
jgi:Ca2+-binding RTX toxin-like protein